jgi:hypothetical protein
MIDVADWAGYLHRLDACGKYGAEHSLAPLKSTCLGQQAVAAAATAE